MPVYPPFDPLAIHRNISGEINLITAKATPVGADLVIIEDSAASYAKKSATLANVIGSVGTTYYLRVDGTNAMAAALDMDGNTMTDVAGSTSSGAAMLEWVSDVAVGSGVVGVNLRWNAGAAVAANYWPFRVQYNNAGGAVDTMRMGYDSTSNAVLWIPDKDGGGDSGITLGSFVVGGDPSYNDASSCGILMAPDSLGGLIDFYNAGTRSIRVRGSGQQVQFASGWFFNFESTTNISCTDRDQVSGSHKIGFQNTTGNVSGTNVIFSDKIVGDFVQYRYRTFSSLNANTPSGGLPAGNGSLLVGGSGYGTDDPASDVTIGAHGWINNNSTNIDRPGSNLLIASGVGTGNDATTGEIQFWTPDAGASGVTVQSLSEKWTIERDGSLVQVSSTAGAGDYSVPDIDLAVGDTTTPDYGLIRTGDAIFGRTSRVTGALDLDGTVVLVNRTAPSGSNILFAMMDNTNSIRFALPKSATGNATYNPRSMLIAGPAPVNDGCVTVSYWQGTGIFDNLVCDTSGSGADLGVQNDLEVEGTIYTDTISESTTAAGVTLTGNLIQSAAAYVDLKNLATPSNPAAGTRRLFVDSGTGELSVRTSAGSTVSLEGGAGGGEANTASNVGTDGVGVWYQKTGVDLEFRHVAPGSTKITTTLNGQDIDVDVVEGNFIHAHDGLSGGGTIEHANLSSVGTNTHAQIDSHISGTTEHGATGAVMGTTNTQTVTNKDLTDQTNKLHWSKGFTIESPADGERFCIYMNERAVTITGVSFASVGGTSVLFNIEYAASIASGTVIHTDTCATSTPEWDVTPSGTTAVPTNQCICIEITTVTGTVDQLHVTIEGDHT